MNEIYALAGRRSAITRWLLLVMSVLVVLNIILQYLKYSAGHDYLFGMIRLFDLDAEANIPTLFSTLLLLSAGLLLLFITSEEKKRGGADTGRWRVLGLVFLFLAVDEAAMLHELFISPGQEFWGKDRPGIFYYAWVIPYFVLVVGLAIYFLGFFLRLPNTTKLRFLLAAVLYVGGSLGFELIEGVEDKLHGEQNTVYWILTTIEEAMEMTGVIVFIDALLQYIDMSRGNAVKS